jgi:hypothetical protein
MQSKITNVPAYTQSQVLELLMTKAKSKGDIYTLFTDRGKIILKLF